MEVLGPGKLSGHEARPLFVRRSHATGHFIEVRRQYTRIRTRASPGLQEKDLEETDGATDPRTREFTIIEKGGDMRVACLRAEQDCWVRHASLQFPFIFRGLDKRASSTRSPQGAIGLGDSQ